MPDGHSPLVARQDVNAICPNRFWRGSAHYRTLKTVFRQRLAEEGGTWPHGRKAWRGPVGESMPCDYEIDPANRLVRVRYWGAFTRDEAIAARERLARDPAFRPDFSELADFSDVTSTAHITTADIQSMAINSDFGHTARRALVASDDGMYGLLRMLQTYREVSGGRERVQVFRTRADAEAWLGLAPGQ